MTPGAGMNRLAWSLAGTLAMRRAGCGLAVARSQAALRKPLSELAPEAAA